MGDVSLSPAAEVDTSFPTRFSSFSSRIRYTRQSTQRRRLKEIRDELLT